MYQGVFGIKLKISTLAEHIVLVVHNLKRVLRRKCRWWSISGTTVGVLPPFSLMEVHQRNHHQHGRTGAHMRAL